LHRCTQIVSCVVFPQNTQNSQNFPTSMQSVGEHISKKFCVFCAFCGNTSQQEILWGSPTDCTDAHRLLGCVVFPQNTQNSRNFPTSVQSVGEHLSKKFCVFCAFCGNTSQQEILCVLRVLWENISARDSVCSASSVGNSKTNLRLSINTTTYERHKQQE
jgi:hypothetical protein